MSNPRINAEEVLKQNLLLVKALMITKTPEERELLNEWAKELGKLPISYEELAIRNEYLWFLLLVLQNGPSGKPPFDRKPRGRLQPLSTIIPRHVYREVSEGSRNTIFFKDIYSNVEKYAELSQTPQGARDESGDESVQPESGPGGGQARSKCKRKKDVFDPCLSFPEMAGVSPDQFFDKQPKPYEGSYCYGCVFSDYLTDENLK